MKNLGFTAIVFGGIAAATLGFAGHASADTGIGAFSTISASGTDTSLVRDSFDASPTTYASPAATIVPWADTVNENDVDDQPWSSVSGSNQ